MDSYFHQSFWRKIADFALIAGKEVIEKALWLYYAAQKPSTPTQAKLIIYSALLYFLSPVDAVPDYVPVVGFADDLVELALAVAMVAMNIDDEVEQKTRQTMHQWFGDTA